MKNMCLLPVWAVLLIIAGTFFSCEKKKDMAIYRQADSLNLLSYRMRYKNLDTACKAAHDAYKLADGFPSLRAGALNNQGFCAFIHMDFEKAEDLFLRVYEESNNELECLIADIGMMKICQRTAMNKEFYDYRNSALRRMKRISDDRSAITDPGELERLNYARSEFSIASAIYYYYLQQEQQSLEAINEIKVDEALESDTAQLLYYYYMKGSGGMYEADTPQDVVLGEFNYLIECLGISREYGYVYFEANASQAMAELLKERKNFDLIMERRPNVMRAINNEDLSWEELTMRFAWQALDLFKKYGDLYQISGTYRTLASCSNEQGRYEDALHYLSEALGYVNRHHEKYYHCTDTMDRLRPYVPMATTSIELEWINDDGIKSVPEWIARFREQLSVTYAALGMKPQSDYNRNIYLDILDYTRQDKELESRYNALEKESEALNGLLVVVVIGIVVLIILFWILNKRWRVRNALYIDKLKRTLEICRKITASVPIDAGEIEDVTKAVVASVIGGWFITAGAAFIICFFVTMIMYFGGMTAMVIMIGVAAFILIRSNNKYRKKMKSEKQDDVFQQMLSSKDKAVVWNLLRQHVRENLVKVLDFAANTYGQMTDGFIREDLKSLRKAVSSTNDEKDILKKIRRKETLGMRRIDRNVAIEKNTWFHLGSNSSEQMMYCLKRMCEPCKEHVDNNFNPLPAECAEEFVPIRDMLKSLLERTKDIIDKGNYEEADLVLAEGEELKTCLSRLHKMRIERMQEENSSVKLSLVYLNLLQESQELVSIMRHMLRASRKFQHV